MRPRGGYGALIASALASASRPLGPRTRYRAFVEVARVVDRLVPDRSATRSGGGARILRYLVLEATRLGLPVELELRTIGLERAYAARERHGALILCSAHTPLDVATRVALDRDGHKVAAITLQDGHRLVIPGTGRSIVRIEPDRHAFSRARRMLKDGYVIVAAQDVPEAPREPGLELPGGRHLKPDLFQFARLVRAPIALTVSRLGADGAIELFANLLLEPPEDEAAALSNARRAAEHLRLWYAGKRA